MMLKMSFFNECLSSLNLQESNAIYAYTRCLDYYSRVQDFCLSLFSKVGLWAAFYLDERSEQRGDLPDLLHHQLQDHSVQLTHPKHKGAAL